jgi:hypothetical protein
MSDIIESLSNPIKFTDHVFVTEGRDGNPTVRTNPETKLPKGIYMLTLKGFGVLYLGISGADRQNAREGTKQRWHAHGQKMTGIFKNAVDTENFRHFREDAVAQGYSLDTILDHIEVRFIPLGKSNKQKIEAMETHLLMSLIARGQCRLNGAKRIPALTKEEYEYVSDQKFLPEGFIS